MADNYDNMTPEELRKVVDEAISSQKASKDSLEKLTDKLRENAKQTDLNTQSLDKWSGKVGNATRAVDSLAKSIMAAGNSERTLNNFSSVLGTSTKVLTSSSRALAGGFNAVGDAVSGVAGFLPGWYKAIGVGLGGLSKLAGAAIGKSADVIDATSSVAETIINQLGVYQQAMGTMSKIGGLTAGGLTELNQQSQAARISLGEWTQMVSKNAQGLAILEGTVAGGTKRMSEMFANESYKTFQSELVGMGMTLGEANEQMAWYSSLMARTGKAQSKSNLELIKGAQSLYLEMDALARLTGTSKEQQKAIADAAATKPDWQIFLSTLDEKTREVYNKQAQKVGSLLGEDRMLDFMNARMGRLDRLDVKKQFGSNQMFYGNMSTNMQEFEKQLDANVRAGVSMNKNLYMINDVFDESSLKGKLYIDALDALRKQKGNEQMSDEQLRALAMKQAEEALKTKNSETKQVTDATMKLNDAATMMSKFNEGLVKASDKVLPQFIDIIMAANKKLAQLAGVELEADGSIKQKLPSESVGFFEKLFGGQEAADKRAEADRVALSQRPVTMDKESAGKLFEKSNVEPIRKALETARSKNDEKQVELLSKQLATLEQMKTNLYGSGTGGAGTLADTSSISKMIANAESAGSYSAKNPNSSASGKYQFTKGTWDSVKSQIGAADKSFDDFMKTPELQEKAMDYLTNSNIAALKKAGIANPTAQQAYLAHHMGVGQAINMIKNPSKGFADSYAGSQQELSNVLAANKSMFSGVSSNADAIAKIEGYFNRKNGIVAAAGGLASGPLGGFPALLHGDEMITPVNGGKFPNEFVGAFHTMLADYHARADNTPMTQELGKANQSLSSAVSMLTTQVELMKRMIEELNRNANATSDSAKSQRKIAAAAV